MDIREKLLDEFDKDDAVDYPTLASELGPDALADLERLVGEDDPRIAAQATCLAGLIGASNCSDVVALAANSEHAVVRVAAAGTLATLPVEQAATIAEPLLLDSDAGVRARAVRFAARSGVETLAYGVQTIADKDPVTAVRDLAAGLVEEFRASRS